MFIAAFYVQRIQMVSVGTQLASAARQSACAGLFGPVCLCASVLLLFHHVSYIFVLSSMSYSKDSSERVLYFCLFVCLFIDKHVDHSILCMCNGFKWFQRAPSAEYQSACAGLFGPLWPCLPVCQCLDAILLSRKRI